MKMLKVISAPKQEINPFVLEDFTLDKVKTSKIEKISKKYVKELAKELALSYDNKSLTFAQKILTAYLEKR